MTRAISLDFTETLVGFRPKSYEYMLGVFRDFGYKISERRLFRALAKIVSKSNFPNKDGVAEVKIFDLLYELGIYPHNELIKSLIKGDSYQEYFIYEDCLDFLKTVKKKYKIYIITNSSRRVHKVVRELGLTDYVDRLIASCDVGIVKPNPKIFTYASRDAEILFHVGDVYEVDYVGAKRAFIKPLLVDRFNFYPEIREKNVNFYEILEDMEENKLI